MVATLVRRTAWQTAPQTAWRMERLSVLLTVRRKECRMEQTMAQQSARRWERWMGLLMAMLWAPQTALQRVRPKELPLEQQRALLTAQLSVRPSVLLWAYL